MAWLYIHGCGGHGKVVADAALMCRMDSGWAGVVATDDRPAAHDYLLPDVSVLSTAVVRNALRDNPHSRFHVAVGDNATRQALVLRYLGELSANQAATVRHAKASVSALASLGVACFVASGAVVAVGSTLGIGVIVNHLAVVDHGCQIGDFCHIAPCAALGGDVRLGQRVLVGAGAVVLAGLRVADDCVIGAGAVVTRDLIEPGAYVGIPARRHLKAAP